MSIHRGYRTILCLAMLLAASGGCDGERRAAEHDRLRNERYELRERVQVLGEERRFLSFLREIHTTDKHYLVLDVHKSRGAVRIGGTIIREFPLVINDCLRPEPASAEQLVSYALPQGRVEMIAKEKDPVWYKPDWMNGRSEALAQPVNDPERLLRGPLGTYALFFGGGFVIHGRPLAAFPRVPFEHACIILEDDDLRTVYTLLKPGAIAYLR